MKFCANYVGHLIPYMICFFFASSIRSKSQVSLICDGGANIQSIFKYKCPSWRIFKKPIYVCVLVYMTYIKITGDINSCFYKCPFYLKFLDLPLFSRNFKGWLYILPYIWFDSSINQFYNCCFPLYSICEKIFSLCHL